jgi:Flp pilus assembly protein TadG
MASKLDRLNRSVRRLDCRLRALARDTKGVVALEFGLVVLPFLLLVFGVVAVGIFYFQVSSIENAAQTAARDIRVGKVQQGSGAYSSATTDTQRKAALLSAFCVAAPTLPNCTSRTAVIVQSSTNFSGISRPSCSSSGTLVSNNTTTFSAGSSSSVVLVTFCYSLSLLGVPVFGRKGGLSDGSYLVQASVAFRTEPY